MVKFDVHISDGSGNRSGYGPPSFPLVPVSSRPWSLDVVNGTRTKVSTILKKGADFYFDRQKTSRVIYDLGKVSR